jgi:hypothetical protein
VKTSRRSPATQADPGRSVAGAQSLAAVKGAPAKFWRGVILLAVVGLAAFWVWALFFASKEAVNKIGDREWAQRAERICAAAQAERGELVDERRLDTDDPQMLAERAAIVDEATDIVETMLDDVVAVPPDDEKGQALVPQWEADYRTYLVNRREFTDRLRAGENEPFTEAAVDGIPISEKLEQFAGDNEMPSCAPPRDLAN